MEVRETLCQECGDVIIHIHLHLSDVPMLQFADFQINENETFQYSVIKNQIYFEMFLIKRNSVLSCYESESCS